MRMRPLVALASTIRTIGVQSSPVLGFGLSAIRSSSNEATSKSGLTHSVDGDMPVDPISILKRANAVCFDVDSTVIPEEGIDVMADFKGQGAAVAELTRGAMGGTVDFRVALRQRMDLIHPSREDMAGILKDHPVVLSPGILDLIDALHARGTHVFLVSGGFRQMIEPVAEACGIPHHRIFANNIIFDDNGGYAGFDTNEPTSADGGKPKVIQMLKDVHGYETVVMIGDGATDMQAKPPADAFIGYGGTSVRENVKAGADLFITSFAELVGALVK